MGEIMGEREREEEEEEEEEEQEEEERKLEKWKEGRKNPTSPNTAHQPCKPKCNRHREETNEIHFNEVLEEF